MSKLQNINTKEVITADPTQQYADLGFVPVTDTITSESLKPAVGLDFTTPDIPPAPSPDGISSDVSNFEMTAPEKDLQTKIDELMNLNLDIAGKEDYRKKQEALQPDLEAQKKAEVDLSAQLKTLQAEAKNISNQMQLDATGRGITAGGLAPIENAAIRMNSIKANTVGALLAATQGKIAYAQGLVDRAVEAEFAPKEAKQKALLANLDLIIKSPEYTTAEKKRAEAQKLIEEKRVADIAKAKEDKKTIMDTATEAAKNGADALTTKKISEAKTPLEAIQLAKGFLDKGKLDTSIIEVGGRKMLINEQTGATIKDLGASDDATKSLMTKYPDAGILPSDDILTAQKKLKNSRIYQKDVRITGGGDSAGTDIDRANVQADINAITGSDGKLDTTKYKQIRQNIATNSPKLLSWFDATYKPDMVLNPNDPTAAGLVKLSPEGELRASGMTREEAINSGDYPRSLIDKVFPVEKKKHWWQK